MATRIPCTQDRVPANRTDRRRERAPMSPGRKWSVPRSSKWLVLDIETAPIVGYVWKIWEENLGIDQLIQDCTLLSFGAKWLGDDKMIYMDVAGQGPENLRKPNTGVRNDYPLMKPILALLNRADGVIAQNGQAFDTKRINTRLITHGFSPYSPVKQIDTFLIAKRHFAFTSNKLEWLAKQITSHEKDRHDRYPGFELWLECLKDNPQAWADMKAYNLQDVIACEEVYFKMRPWAAKSHPNVGTYSMGLQTVCRVCESSNVQADGYETLSASQYVRYHCKDCGAWMRGKEMLTPKEVRDVKVS